jgi:hypothetical protein
VRKNRFHRLVAVASVSALFGLGLNATAGTAGAAPSQHQSAGDQDFRKAQRAPSAT